MTSRSNRRDIYLSFFMFTTNLAPEDADNHATIIRHVRALQRFGYTGFEFPIAPTPANTAQYATDLRNYRELRNSLNVEGLEAVKITTNVGATRTCDPSSPYPEQRKQALEYLKSRVDITAALGGEIMMGPLVLPYGIFPLTDFSLPVWSDVLQDELPARYANAAPVLNELGLYAQDRNVKIAIEPITHWETPGPNTLSQLMQFLKQVPCKQVGVVIDSAHETLDGAGPIEFAQQVAELAAEQRLHYVQVSPPDRGALHISWLPWESFLRPILKVYPGPIAVEIFNAIPAFINSLRLTRRKFWIPGEDPRSALPSAYDTAAAAFEATKLNIDAICTCARPN